MNRVNRSDRIIPGPALSLTLQHVFVSSISSSLKQELFNRFGDKNTGRLIGMSLRLKKDFLKEHFNVNSEFEIFKKIEEISKKHQAERDEIINYTGLGKKELPKWFISKFKQYIKEHDKK